MASLEAEKSTAPSYPEKDTTTDIDHEPRLHHINETGHIQELERNFSLLSVCSVGIVTGNTWAALGGSIVVAIYNGGPPGVLYEFIAVSAFYWLIAACIAVSPQIMTLLFYPTLTCRLGTCFVDA